MTRGYRPERRVTYFVFDEAKHVTGQVVSVDGAQSLYHPLVAVRMDPKA